MEIKTTEQIWKEFCEQLDLEVLEVGAKTRVNGWCRPYQEENKDKKWVAIGDIIKELRNPEVNEMKTFEEAYDYLAN